MVPIQSITRSPDALVTLTVAGLVDPVLVVVPSIGVDWSTPVRLMTPIVVFFPEARVTTTFAVFTGGLREYQTSTRGLPPLCCTSVSLLKLEPSKVTSVTATAVSSLTTQTVRSRSVPAVVWETVCVSSSPLTEVTEFTDGWAVVDWIAARKIAARRRHCPTCLTKELADTRFVFEELSVWFREPSTSFTASCQSRTPLALNTEAADRGSTRKTSPCSD